jgi:hypothetical protein
MPATSALRLDLADLERLLVRFPLPHASGIRLANGKDRLVVEVDQLRVPSPLVPPFPATFELTATMVEGTRNVVAVHLQVQKLPMGMQLLANPFLDKLVEQVLPEGAEAYVEVRSPSLVWVYLERIPEYGRPFADAVTVTHLLVPGRKGSAAEVGFAVRRP